MAAPGEDRPIVVSGGNEMYTISLPADTTPLSGVFTTLAQNGPFTSIEVVNADTKQPVYKGTAEGNWIITIQ